jgi:hypothetical protein
MKTRILISALFAAGALAGLGIGLALAGSDGDSGAVQARAVASQFFRTIDQRRYAQTCDLLSARFYRQNHVPNRRHCVLGLSIGMAMAPSYRFRITGVQVTRDGAIVSALANGLPGHLVLVRERDGFKVLAVQGG